MQLCGDSAGQVLMTQALKAKDVQHICRKSVCALKKRQSWFPEDTRHFKATHKMKYEMKNQIPCWKILIQLDIQRGKLEEWRGLSRWQQSILEFWSWDRLLTLEVENFWTGIARPPNATDHCRYGTMIQCYSCSYKSHDLRRQFLL